MKTLSFLSFFREKLLKGEKKLTIRIGDLTGKYKKGDLVKIDCGGKILAIAEIEEVYKKKLFELSEEEIKLDGFKDKDEFFKTLKQLYKIKDINNFDVTVIRFKILEILDVDQYNYVYKGYKIDEIVDKGLEMDLPEEEKKILKRLKELKSIRAVAMELGGLNKRYLVRKILRKVLKKLEEKI